MSNSMFNAIKRFAGDEGNEAGTVKVIGLPHPSGVVLVRYIGTNDEFICRIGDLS